MPSKDLPGRKKRRKIRDDDDLGREKVVEFGFEGA
jgi:hypothetical protein